MKKLRAVLLVIVSVIFFFENKVCGGDTRCPEIIPPGGSISATHTWLSALTAEVTVNVVVENPSRQYIIIEMMDGLGNPKINHGLPQNPGLITRTVNFYTASSVYCVRTYFSADYAVDDSDVLVGQKMIDDGVERECPLPIPTGANGRISDFVAEKWDYATRGSFKVMADYNLMFYQFQLVNEDIYSEPIFANPIGTGEVYSYTFPIKTEGCVRLWKQSILGYKELYGVQKAIEIPPPPTAARLGYFRAIRGSEETAIYWKTLVEVNVLGFYVERSEDQASWERVSELIPAQGQGGAPQPYEVGVSPSTAEYYRLVEVDLSGYQNEVAVSKVSKEEKTLSVHTTNGKVFLTIKGKPEEKVSLEETDSLQNSWRGEIITLNENGLFEKELDRNDKAFFRVCD